MLHADDGGEPFANVFALEPVLHLLEEVLRRAVAVEHLRERRAQAGEVRAAVLVVDVVRVTEDLLRVARVPLQRDLDPDRRSRSFDSLLPDDRDDLVVHRLLRLVQVLDELADAALVLEQSPCALRPRSSVSVMTKPAFRNESSRRRLARMS